MSLLNRHLLRATAGPFLFGFFVITFLLIIDILYRYVELFVSKGVSFVVATEVLLLSLGHTFALSVPMAVLIGVLMGVGQLAADQEITAMKASGIGLYAILRPLLFGALLIGGALAAYNHYVFPESNHKLANLLYDIKHKRPMLEIREQLFTDLGPRTTIYVEEKNETTNEIHGVVIIERDGAGDPTPTVTTAEHGLIVPLHETDTLRIELFDGEIHELPDDNDLTRYSITRFQRHNIHIRDAERDMKDSARTSRGDREMDLVQLRAAAAEQHVHYMEAVHRQHELARSLADQQWRLLDPDERLQLVDRRGRPGKAPINEKQRAVLFDGTIQEVRKAIRAAEFQEGVLVEHVARGNQYEVEFQKKFAIPAACLVFVLLGLPMAVTTARTGKGISVTLALALFLVYYLFLVAGEKMADRGRLDPVIAMWAANVALTLAGIPALIRTVRESSSLDLSRPFRRRSAAGRDAP
jgi:lipopolysaccharide export system permease protein